MNTAVIGMGSNIDAERHLREAADLLRGKWPACRFSAVYRTAPREVADQDDFLNAAARMETDDAPEAILRALRDIEEHLRRTISYRFGPRTIDLDLLLVGNTIRDMPHLTLPHARMHERRFVLEPLIELLSPAQRHPRLGRTWSDLLSQTLDQRCDRLPAIIL